LRLKPSALGKGVRRHARTAAGKKTATHAKTKRARNSQLTTVLL
jgi:hypothetical protein